ncbi:MAG: CoA-binding protein [Thermodesulfobacteriota bacterium]|nr:CoA-binding protein [Thermodesulfobacteriota bacterium]
MTHFFDRQMAIESQDIDYIFHPRSVAVAGVSNELENLVGFTFLKPLMDFGLIDKIYPLNPKGGEYEGLKIYSALTEIPGHVDHVIIGIPASLTPQLMRECVAKDVKAVTLFTSGFSEIQSQDAKRLEDKVLKIARQGGVRILGPNCMGIYCPKTGLSFDTGFSKESGPVGFIAQSGGNCITGIKVANARGIHFSKAISYGNACDLNECNLLEYLAQDPETEIIIAYIEGVKDGRRFSRVLKETVKTKPVIIFKGGLGQAGARSTASHTGSLAGSDKIWDGIIRQAGAIRVYSIDEMLDVALAFLHMPAPKGRNIAVIGAGGGASVLAADDCERAGLKVPSLPLEIQSKLTKFTPEVGSFFKNPVDSQWIIHNPEQFADATIKMISDWEGIDYIILHTALEMYVTQYFDLQQTMINKIIDSFLESAKNCPKPTAVTFHPLVSERLQHAVKKKQQDFSRAGIPVYPSLWNTANAIAKFIQYHNDDGNGH